MTTRSERTQRFREWKAALLARVAGRVLSRRTSGLDGFAKRLLGQTPTTDVAADPELSHPREWDRPVD